MERLEARIQVALEVGTSCRGWWRVQRRAWPALESVQKPEDEDEELALIDAPDAGARGLRRFNWMYRRQPQSKEKSDG